LENGAPPQTILQDLREVDFGGWTGLNWEQVCAKFNLLTHEWLDHIERGVAPNGETGPKFRARVEPCLRKIIKSHPGQTVGIFPVQNSTPEPVIAEIEKIMDTGEGGLNQNLIKLQPIARLNAILVASNKPALLKTAQNWIKRLDNSQLSSTGVKVYRVRYGDAKLLAQVLNDMFGSGSTGSSIDSASSQIAPGGGVTTSSSSTGAAGGGAITPIERLTGGPTPAKPGADSPAANAALNTLGGSRGGAAAGSPILPGVRITADITNNSLLIYASEEGYRIIEGALRQIDRPQLQVAFDATIAEVTLNDSLTYGVQFFLKSSNVGAPPDTGSAISTIGTSALLSRVLPGFNILVGSEATPQVVIDALHGVTDVKILSNPSLVVVDNGGRLVNVGKHKHHHQRCYPCQHRKCKSITGDVVNNLRAIRRRGHGAHHGRTTQQGIQFDRHIRTRGGRVGRHTGRLKRTRHMTLLKSLKAQ